MAISQTASGKSFEYALASAFAQELGVDIEGSALAVARRYYEVLESDGRLERDCAAIEAVRFILTNEPLLRAPGTDRITLQSDRAGVPGDVRDIVLHLTSGVEVGISAKVRNTAIRNSRLSPKIDFAEKWFGSKCSDDYHEETSRVWEYLGPLEADRAKWSNLADKAGRVYQPLQRAFIREVRHQLGEDAPVRAGRLMRYLLGTHDYYKVYKHNSALSIESFNMGRTLSWGKSFPMPSALVRMAMKPGSRTTSLMVLDEGWQLSFRLHSAESVVKRSLKFDVQIVGQPPRLTRHELHYR